MKDNYDKEFTKALKKEGSNVSKALKKARHDSYGKAFDKMTGIKRGGDGKINFGF